MKARKTVKKNSCGDCHACCQYFLITLTDVPDDALAFYRTWGIEMDRNGNSTLLKILSPCKHLTHGGCDIYDKRPTYCRQFECAG
jgi:Fe-S-cluster containining protein